MTNEYAYFGADFEKYFRTVMAEYSLKEQEAVEVYHVTSKPGKQKLWLNIAKKFQNSSRN